MNFFSNLYFNFSFFHVFKVNVQNIISIDQKKICTYFTRKNSKVELHSSKTFFWWHISNFAVFSCIMVCLLNLIKSYYVSKSEEEDKKNFN